MATGMEPRAFGDPFPSIEITGDGPTGSGTKVVVDGVEQKRLTGATLVFGVNDVNYLRLDHAAVIASVRTTGEVEHRYVVDLVGHEGAIGSGHGGSIAEALRDLAGQLEAAETS